MQQILTALEGQRTDFNGYVGCDRATLGLSTLSAVAHLNRLKCPGDREADASAEAGSLVFDAHTVFKAGVGRVSAA